MDLEHCLYLSRFSGRLGVTGLRDLLQQARENNLRHDITGALLFDGDRFVQLIEGPSARIRALTASLRTDARHQAFQLLFEGPVATRHGARWKSGYVDLEQVDRFVLSAAEGPGNTTVLIAAFDALLQSADLD